MEDKLTEILESFNVPVYRQGSMSESEAYPETFITFWNNDSYDHAYYDNTEYGTNWDFNVYVYSEKAAKVYSLISDIRKKLKAADWIVPSRGFDAQSDEETHIGRGLECYFLDVSASNDE